MSRIDVDDLVNAFKTQAVSQEAMDLITLQVCLSLPPSSRPLRKLYQWLVYRR